MEGPDAVSMNPHIHPSPSGVLCGRRGWMEVVQCAGECKLARPLQLSLMDLLTEGKGSLFQTMD